jgi:hypothetical protein
MKKKQNKTLIALLKKTNLQSNKTTTYSQFKSDMSIQKYTTDNTNSLLLGSSPGIFADVDFDYITLENNNYLFTENDDYLITD